MSRIFSKIPDAIKTEYILPWSYFRCELKSTFSSKHLSIEKFKIWNYSHFDWKIKKNQLTVTGYKTKIIKKIVRTLKT